MPQPNASSTSEGSEQPEGSTSTIIAQSGADPNTQPLEHWVWLMPRLLQLLTSEGGIDREKDENGPA